jgi:RNA polymerase sigma-70 factor (ECF subfamily)
MQPLDVERHESAEDSDAWLVQRSLSGDTEAFGQIVSRYQGALYRHAVAMVVDYDEAADLVQDSFVRAYGSLEQCREPQRLRAWLFQIVRNRCLDFLKDIRRRTVPLDGESLVDSREGPAAAIERASLRADISRALARLPDAQREAFVMHYVQGLSYDVMSDLLDASVSALKMRTMRAREALAAELDARHVTHAPVVRLGV